MKKLLDELLKSKGFGYVIKDEKYRFLREWIDNENHNRFTNDILNKIGYERMSYVGRVFLLYHDYTDIIKKCKCCGKEIIQKDFRISNGTWKIQEFCSKKCSSLGTVEKRKSIFLEKYGCENPFQNENVKKKIRKTNLEKYGCDNPSKSNVIKKKKRDKCIAKYGVGCTFQADDVKSKSKITCNERYGVDNPTQNHELLKKTRQRYYYNNIGFDSAPELALYIYLKDNNIDFEYQPNISFVYECNGKSHKYFPDFRIGDKVVEIKGDYFLRDGVITCPWDDKCTSLYRAKYECMKHNNVKILFTEDYMKYLVYVYNTYGKDYLIQFKGNKNG